MRKYTITLILLRNGTEINSPIYRRFCGSFGKVILFAFLSLLLTACSSAPNTVEATVQAASVGLQTAQAVSPATPESIATPIPGNTLVSSAADTPTQTGSTAPLRIQFAPGTASFTLRDQAIAANSSNAYILRAMEGQELWIGVNPQTFQDYDNFTITIYGAESGTLLVSDAIGHWSGVVPVNEDYIVAIYNHSNAATYALDVIIPRRIVFTPGATSNSIEGNIVEPNNNSNSYVLHAREGQTMSVVINTHEENVLCLTIVGSDGQPIVRSHLCQTHWVGLLHATQDYYISVMAREGATTASSNVGYTLEISITD